MTEVPEIPDSDSLRAWLAGLPQDTEADQTEAQRIATTIAHRAAMRVLPLSILGMSAGSNPSSIPTPLATFRAVLMSGVVAFQEDPTIACRISIIADLHSLSSRAPASAMPAMLAAGSAASALASFSASSLAAAFDCTSMAVNYSFAVANFEESFLSLAEDRQSILNAATLHRRPLWHGNRNPIHVEWDAMRNARLSSGPEWKFWTDWYEKCLDGAPQDLGLSHLDFARPMK